MKSGAVERLGEIGPEPPIGDSDSFELARVGYGKDTVGSRDTHGTHGRTQTHGSHRRISRPPAHQAPTHRAAARPRDNRISQLPNPRPAHRYR